MEAFMNAYLLDALVVYCEICGKPICEDWRKDKSRKPLRFCSRSCANTHTRTERSKLKTKHSVNKSLLSKGFLEIYCDNCGKMLPQVPNEKNDYRHLCKECRSSMSTQSLYKSLIERWKNGENVSTELSHEHGINILELKESAKIRIKSFLLEEQNHCCSICGQPDIHQNKPLTFILDHIDGDWTNQLKSNFRLVCPNCNSQLETTLSRTGKGRLSVKYYAIKQKQELKAFEESLNRE
jgi:hypothetical protein